MGKLVTLLVLFVSCTGISQPLQLIPLKAADAYVNQNFKDEINKLFDGDVNTRFTVWSPQFLPYRISFDLGDYDSCIIKQLKYFVGDGGPHNMRYYYVRKDNGEKVLFFTFTGGIWNPQYVTVDIPDAAIAKQLILETNGNDDFPAELQLYGSFTPHTWPAITLAKKDLSELMGVVLKPWDIANNYWPEKIPVLKENGVRRVRLYNDYPFNHNADGSWSMNGGWKQIDNMQLLKVNGITTQMDYLAFPYYPFDTAHGARTNTDTYVQAGKDIYAFGLSNIQNGEYFRTIEVGNELNKWYGSNPALEYMDGYALAAMMSVCYDGHHGKYLNCGLKASGSQATVSLSGMASGEPDILYEMIQWSISNRGYRSDGSVDLPFDIYSFHVYNSLGGQYSSIPGGVNPERGVEHYLQRLNGFRKKYAPWLKLYAGEWSGGDINPNSPLNAPAFGSYSADQTSAMWTIRELLLMAENEIDAASYYRVKSDYDALSDADGSQFATMALERQHSTGIKQSDGSYTGIDMRRTLTGDYFKQLSEFFNSGWTFDSRLSSSPNVLLFKKGSDELYALWEAENMTVTDRPYFTERTSTYQLPKNGTLRRLVDDSSGSMSSENYLAGTPLTINAKPIFIAVSAQPIPLPVTFVSFTAQKVNEAVVLKWVVEGTDSIEVESSTDGIHFSLLGTGIFNKYVDPHPYPGKNYYRLRMTEAGGKASYSPIRMVSFRKMHLTVMVFNSIGQRIALENTEDLEAWKEQLRHRSNLSPGFYVLNVFDGNRFLYADKFVK